MNAFDVIVIGAGQAGLAAGYHLKRRGLDFTLLDANPEIGGSWQHYYDNLKLFSPARYSSLPGMRFPGDPDHYPTRTEVIEYLRAYATRFEIPVVNHARVVDVSRAEDGCFHVQLEDGRVFAAHVLISASGPHSSPHMPEMPGQEDFAGRVLHSFDYDNPAGYEDQHVVVVGGGDSAMQIAYELAKVARVTMATRRPLSFMPQRLLGQEIHFWLHGTGFDRLPVGLVRRLQGTPMILESGPYREALKTGNPAVKPMFTRFTADGVIWGNGESESADSVIFATGYRPGLGYLRELGALDEDGNPCHRGGVSERMPGLFYVGLFGQRSHSSATLRGVGADAGRIADRARAYIRQRESAHGYSEQPT